MNYCFQTASAEETVALAKRFSKNLRRGDVVAYRGGLGAGKTAFTRGLADGLHCKGEVCSPTFALVHEYPSAISGGVTLYHFDMYRISDSDDLYATGYDDYLSGGGILAIEWSENIEDVLPENTITVTITVIGENNRSIEIDSERELSF